MIVLGIDPGASGGFALRTDGAIDTACAAFGAATEREVFEALTKHRADFAIIEKVHSMPKQGVASSFKFGQSYGFLRGCLIASGIPFEEVTPQRWQKEMGCLTKGDKNVSKRRAQQLFPGLKVTHATADALLLAEYGRRLLASRNPTPTTP